jgi:Ca2+:H+ antiporter
MLSRLAPMNRWPYVLLLFVPAALLAGLLGLPPLAIFVLAALALVPLAGLIGEATEHLAHHLGPRYGGLLNATFGNAAELIITVFGVREGLLTLVKASITGSIIGNSLLVLGTSLVAGGLRNGLLRYDARSTSMSAAMMLLAVGGLYLPATVALTLPEAALRQELSYLVAGVLLLTYVVYLVYSVQHPSEAEGDPLAAVLPAEAPPRHEGARAARRPGAPVGVWSVRRAILVLTGATVGAAVASELLVDAVHPVTEQLGWSEFFVGVIVVALVGNAAEHFSAVQFAWRNRPEVTLAITTGSSMQLALFVAPVLVLLSPALGHPMDLVFVPLELAILGLTTAIFAYICLDGESNWLEGVQLLAIYLMAAFAFFFLPVPP